jgi:Na+/phosphate symporter
MKDEPPVFNPFRILSPNLDSEAEHFAELYKRPVSEGIALGEGLLVMLSKLIEICRLMSGCVGGACQPDIDKCDALAKEVDNQERLLTRNLVEADLDANLLKGLIRFPHRLERIGDLFEGMLDCCRMKGRFDLPFSDAGYRELDEMFATLIEMMVNLRNTFISPSKPAIEQILSAGKKLSSMVEESTITHWIRLDAGLSQAEASTLFRHILEAVKSANDYLIKMATTLSEVSSRD